MFVYVFFSELLSTMNLQRLLYHDGQAWRVSQRNGLRNPDNLAKLATVV